MNYYFIVTDINSRQYVFPIDETGGVTLFYSNQNIIIDNNYNISSLLILLNDNISFVVNNHQIFNSKNLVSLEIKGIPKDSY